MAGDVVARRHRRGWADQDVAFAITQWCSGITQKEIAGHFGYRGAAALCVAIDVFIRKYYADVPLGAWTRDNNGERVNCIVAQGDDRKRVAQIAFCYFMAQRDPHAA